MTVRILFRKPYGPLKCNKIILNIMIIWTITQPVISWEFFKISFLQIIINYSTNSEKKTENWCFDWALICDSPSLLQWSCVQVWPNWGPLAVKLHFLQSNPTVHQHNSSVLIAAYLHSLFLSLPFSTPQMTPVLKYISSSFLCLVSCVATVGAHKRNANQIQTLQSKWTHFDLTLCV